MNSEELTHKAEEEIAALISKKVAELRKKTGQEVSEIEFVPRETMKGLEDTTLKLNYSSV
ncbi:addiction module toxin, GnsA/GnsB family [Salmonella enterica subsp. enterica serovar Infantis]|nr:addiction module toxin, GnsA/GnsB family [Salmonella enterica subsp. enterica serovar Infantis]